MSELSAVPAVFCPRYDIVGLVFSVAGVIFVIFFAPNNPEQLSSERLNKLLIGWGAITIYIVYGLLIVLLLFVVKKKGHTTVLYYTLLSSLIGSFTVMASKPVATFIILGIEGAASDHLYTELKVARAEPDCVRLMADRRLPIADSAAAGVIQL